MAGIVEEIIPRLLTQYLTPDQVGFLTISAVEISGDLGVCDVFIRSIQGPKNFLSQLKKSEKRISHLLTKELNQRRSIIVRFKPDKAVDQVKKIAEIDHTITQNLRKH